MGADGSVERCFYPAKQNEDRVELSCALLEFRHISGALGHCIDLGYEEGGIHAGGINKSSD